MKGLFLFFVFDISLLFFNIQILWTTVERNSFFEKKGRIYD